MTRKSSKLSRASKLSHIQSQSISKQKLSQNRSRSAVDLAGRSGTTSIPGPSNVSAKDLESSVPMPNPVQKDAVSRLIDIGESSETKAAEVVASSSTVVKRGRGRPPKASRHKGQFVKVVGTKLMSSQSNVAFEAKALAEDKGKSQLKPQEAIPEKFQGATIPLVPVKWKGGSQHVGLCKKSKKSVKTFSGPALKLKADGNTSTSKVCGSKLTPPNSQIVEEHSPIPLMQTEMKDAEPKTGRQVKRCRSDDASDNTGNAQKRRRRADVPLLRHRGYKKRVLTQQNKRRNSSAASNSVGGKSKKKTKSAKRVRASSLQLLTEAYLSSEKLGVAALAHRRAGGTRRSAQTDRDRAVDIAHMTNKVQRIGRLRRRMRACRPRLQVNGESGEKLVQKSLLCDRTKNVAALRDADTVSLKDEDLSKTESKDELETINEKVSNTDGSDNCNEQPEIENESSCTVRKSEDLHTLVDESNKDVISTSAACALQPKTATNVNGQHSVSTSRATLESTVTTQSKSCSVSTEVTTPECSLTDTTCSVLMPIIEPLQVHNAGAVVDDAIRNSDRVVPKLSNYEDAKLSSCALMDCSAFACSGISSADENANEAKPDDTISQKKASFERCKEKSTDDVHRGESHVVALSDKVAKDEKLVQSMNNDDDDDNGSWKVQANVDELKSKLTMGTTHDESSTTELSIAILDDDDHSKPLGEASSLEIPTVAKLHGNCIGESSVQTSDSDVSMHTEENTELSRSTLKNENQPIFSMSIEHSQTKSPTDVSTDVSSVTITSQQSRSSSSSLPPSHLDTEVIQTLVSVNGKTSETVLSMDTTKTDVSLDSSFVDQSSDSSLAAENPSTTKSIDATITISDSSSSAVHGSMDSINICLATQSSDALSEEKSKSASYANAGEANVLNTIPSLDKSNAGTKVACSAQSDDESSNTASTIDNANMIMKTAISEDISNDSVAQVITNISSHAHGTNEAHISRSEISKGDLSMDVCDSVVHVVEQRVDTDANITIDNLSDGLSIDKNQSSVETDKLSRNDSAKPAEYNLDDMHDGLPESTAADTERKLVKTYDNVSSMTCDTDITEKSDEFNKTITIATHDNNSSVDKSGDTHDEIGTCGTKAKQLDTFSLPVDAQTTDGAKKSVGSSVNGHKRVRRKHGKHRKVYNVSKRGRKAGKVEKQGDTVPLPPLIVKRMTTRGKKNRFWYLFAKQPPKGEDTLPSDSLAAAQQQCKPCHVVLVDFLKCLDLMPALSQHTNEMSMKKSNNESNVSSPDQSADIYNEELSAGDEEDESACEPRFQCLQCTFSCNTRSAMHKHIYEHTERLPFSCSVCSAPLSKSRSISLHVHHHHPSAPATAVRVVCERDYYEELGKVERRPRIPVLQVANPGLPYQQCCRCTFSANSVEVVRRHVMRMHSAERRLVCPLCQRAYCRLHSSMMQHFRKNHPGEPVVYRYETDYYSVVAPSSDTTSTVSAKPISVDADESSVIDAENITIPNQLASVLSEDTMIHTTATAGVMNETTSALTSTTIVSAAETCTSNVVTKQLLTKASVSMDNKAAEEQPLALTKKVCSTSDNPQAIDLAEKSTDIPSADVVFIGNQQSISTSSANSEVLLESVINDMISSAVDNRRIAKKASCADASSAGMTTEVHPSATHSTSVIDARNLGRAVEQMSTINASIEARSTSLTDQVNSLMTPVDGPSSGSDGSEVNLKIVNVESLVSNDNDQTHSTGIVAPDISDSDTSLEEYVCKKCGAVMLGFEAIIDHVTTEHGDGVWYACPHCTFGCSQQRENIRRHMRRAHVDQPAMAQIGLIDEDRYFVKRTDSGSTAEVVNTGVPQRDLQVVESNAQLPVEKTQHVLQPQQQQQIRPLQVMQAHQLMNQRQVSPTVLPQLPQHLPQQQQRAQLIQRQQQQQQLLQGELSLQTRQTTPRYTSMQHQGQLVRQAMPVGSPLLQQRHAIRSPHQIHGLPPRQRFPVQAHRPPPLQQIPSHSLQQLTPRSSTPNPPTVVVLTDEEDDEDIIFMGATSKRNRNRVQVLPGPPSEETLSPGPASQQPLDMSASSRSSVSVRQPLMAAALARAPVAHFINGAAAMQPRIIASQPHLRAPPPLIPLDMVEPAHMPPTSAPGLRQPMVRAHQIPANNVSVAAPDDNVIKEAFNVFNLRPRSQVVNAERFQRPPPPPYPHQRNSMPASQSNIHRYPVMAHGQLPQVSAASNGQPLPMVPRTQTTTLLQCPYCAFSVNDRSKLHMHILSHQPDIHWTCPYCPMPNQMTKAFVEKHIRNCHPRCRVVYLPFGL